MTAAYVQHPPLTLAPFEQMSPHDQALHLVHDHGYTADYLYGTDSHVRYTGPADGDEHAVAYFTGLTPLGRADWHSPDHDEYDRAVRAGDLDWPSFDRETGTSNVHLHGEA